MEPEAHFFLDFELDLDFGLGVGAEPLDATLVALDVAVDVALLPFFRLSSFLFCIYLASYFSYFYMKRL